MEDEPETAQQWRDTSADPWPLDTLLRSRGWVLIDRPKAQEAIWKRHGVTCSFNDALDYVLQEWGFHATKKAAYLFRHPNCGVVDRAEALRRVIEWSKES